MKPAVLFRSFRVHEVITIIILCMSIVSFRFVGVTAMEEVLSILHYKLSLLTVNFIKHYRYYIQCPAPNKLSSLTMNMKY